MTDRSRDLASLDNPTLARMVADLQEELSAARRVNRKQARALLAAEQERDMAKALQDAACRDRDTAIAECETMRDHLTMAKLDRTELTTARATTQRLQLERDGAMVQRDAALPIVRAARGWVATVDAQAESDDFVDAGERLCTAIDTAPPDLLALAEAAEGADNER
jgi:hypothetical protein